MPDPLLLIGGNDRSLWANRGHLIGELLETGWEVHGALPPKERVRYPALFPIPIHRPSNVDSEGALANTPRKPRRIESSRSTGGARAASRKLGLPPFICFKVILHQRLRTHIRIFEIRRKPRGWRIRELRHNVLGQRMNVRW
jgi:hypothetical protein